MNKNILLIFGSLGIIILGFILGWLFPVEGPYDYIYDEAVKEKRPSVNIPRQQEPKIIIDEDEELEILYILPPMPVIGE